MLSNRQLFLQHLAQTSDAPMMLEIVKAEGMYMYDAEGQKYLDLISGISVSNLGHRHPAIVEAIKNQTDQYLHLMVYGEIIQSPQTKLASELNQVIHFNKKVETKQLNCFYFTNSGSEAIEGALKLAKRFTGKNEIVAMYDSYHGSTHGAMSLMSNEYFTNNYRPLLPGVSFIRFNNQDDLNYITDKTACVVTEIIRAECGIELPSREYLIALKNRCRETGTILIADEIQTGLMRTGSMFAYEDYEIVPDILVLGKALGGGLPIGAFCTSHEIMKSLSENPVLGHITTFGGNPLVCAAALANLVALQKSIQISDIHRKSEMFKKLLKHKLIHSVMLSGLMIAVEFENSSINKRIIKRCIENGVITDWFLFAEHKMRIAPPLIISDPEINHACKIILNACENH